MSLLGNRPSPTHKAMDLARLVNLGMELESVAPDGTVTPDALESFASEQGVALREAYASVPFNPTLRFDRPNDAAFIVCSGGCQGYGALEQIDTLLAIRSAREAAGDTSFDICTKTCLDACDHGPVVVVQTADGGVAKITKCDSAKLKEAVDLAVE